MLKPEEAKSKGIRACMDAIGYQFCLAHSDTATSACGLEDHTMYCFVGVDDTPNPFFDLSSYHGPQLTSGPNTQFPYHASCNVNLQDGTVELLSCRASCQNSFPAIG